MKLYQEQHINNLPDCYNKEETSNNHKILDLSDYNVTKLRKTLTEIENSLNLNNAKGKTLDLYGDLVGQKRGLATDEQYIILIKTRIMRNLVNGSNNSITAALSAILNCKQSEVHIADAKEPCKVSVTAPLTSIIGSDFTISQFVQLVQTLTPVGVTLSADTVFGGTFEFATGENEYDEKAGFCDVEGGTIGGYFGALSTDQDEIVLPI